MGQPDRIGVYGVDQAQYSVIQGKIGTIWILTKYSLYNTIISCIGICAGYRLYTAKVFVLLSAV